MPQTDPHQPETTAHRATEPGPSRRTGRSGVARHRTGGRRRGLVPGLVALLGLGVAGAVTAVAVGDDRPTDRVSVAAEESARAAAAQRVDRAAREAAGPTTSPVPTATPTPSAAATTRPPTAKPSRSSASAKAVSPTASRKAPAWVDPMPGAGVTSCYGMRWGTMHAGIDLAMPADTPIQAAGAGTVVDAGWAFAGYGISVVVDHGNGWLTHYAHQSRTVVSVGQRVKPGQVIGYEGATGDTTGPHLHFEVHNGLWNQVDPAPWMRARGVDLGC
ncbi:M23 family metallopeptidase [Plantactinospora sp. KLBMP9567]|uniref:M23 family metallopeptidase n=1 Tax=Plantactinospora sp. KLBMP9567 TaxID=3085900 RepID=UPI002980BEDA|nr:peptidoglycan DD-metalloendopeptidase family protein [Plantactinospora sp. KLBMP9567]MDW5324504.1 peptidoglycan DD-metalloendopeptidase family protein [Plantactinospora sp. KLBMP9567]